jgi:AraC-like DNA-binding protein
MGPVCTKPDDEKIAVYARKHKLDSSFLMRQRTPGVFMAAITLLYYCMTGETVSEMELIPPEKEPGCAIDTMSNQIQNYLMDNAENEISRMSYHDEQMFFIPVRNGDVEAVKHHFDTEYLQKIPNLAQNKHKHYEYMVCSAITLATRAAIQGGLDVFSAYAISDLYLRSLEKCKTVDDIFRLHKSMMIAFAQKVNEATHNRIQHSVVEKAKCFINNNLNNHLSLDDIAKNVNTSKAHLSRIFAKKASIGINQYIQAKRVEAASNMLKYSDEDISSIAAYLCFPSQSHFGKIFKQHTGYTPQQYRNKEKLSDTI